MSPAKATFAAGCFWGIEHMLRKQFPQLIDARVGYIGGTKTNPTYGEVYRGDSGCNVTSSVEKLLETVKVCNDRALDGDLSSDICNATPEYSRCRLEVF